MLNKFFDLHILYLACLLIPLDFIEKRKIYRSILMILTTICMYIFINTQYTWILFIIWEILGIISYVLICNTLADLQKCIRILLVNLLSGTILLFTIINLPYNSVFTSIDLSSYMSQIGLALAICIKSGLYPFTWPQDASIATVPITSFLHSATIIQLGVYLLLKVNTKNLIILQTIIYLLVLLTFIWAILQIRQSITLKQKIAMLTQCFTAITLVQIGNNTPHNIIYITLAIHALYKTLIFIYSNKTNTNQTYTPVDITYLLLAFVMSSKLFINIHGHFLFYSTNYFITQYIFIALIQLIRTKRLIYKVSYIDILFLPSIVVLIQYQLSGFCFNYLFICVSLLCYLFNAIAIRVINILKQVQLPRLDLGISTINLSITEVIYYSILLIVGYIEFSLPLKYLVISKFDLLNITTTLIAIFYLVRARNSYEAIVSLSLISAVVAFNFIQHGGIDICVTHILADTLVALAIIRGLRNAHLITISIKNLLISALIALVIILSHPGYRNGLVFPMLHTCNMVNEVVINWRLFDTLGELIVFYTCGRIIRAIK